MESPLGRVATVLVSPASQVRALALATSLLQVSASGFAQGGAPEPVDVGRHRRRERPIVCGVVSDVHDYAPCCGGQCVSAPPHDTRRAVVHLLESALRAERAAGEGVLDEVDMGEHGRLHVSRPVAQRKGGDVPRDLVQRAVGLARRSSSLLFASELLVDQSPEDGDSGGGLDLGTFIKYPSVSVKEGGPSILTDYQKRKSLSAKEEMPGFEEIPLDPIPWGNQILEEKEVGDDMLFPGGPTWGLQGFQEAQKISCELRE